MDLSSLFSGIRTADSLLSRVLTKRGTKIQKKIEAVSNMQRAINSTERYLVESNRHFQPNAELSEQWLIAFTSMISVDKVLAQRLKDKSRFWSNPQHWIQESSSMDLIPDLNELNEKCDMLLIELESRT